NGRHTYVEPSADHTSWRICQVLIDPEELNDWQAEFTVDLAQAREDGKPTLKLTTVRKIE
ncbi:MAG: box helicase, partial [Prosthecobacter sp.]|nr:box helicase [Prosthecobacter sp.]